MEYYINSLIFSSYKAKIPSNKIISVGSTTSHSSSLAWDTKLYLFFIFKIYYNYWNKIKKNELFNYLGIFVDFPSIKLYKTSWANSKSKALGESKS